uniref:RNA-directed RNA polymerase n=1 Tax=Grapevine-associated tombus-like virus 1 TaxID=2814341 RepID=A0A8F5ML25_9TOMB|nr:MAG: RNA-dependent RNA polymerase [Grapevine-associated tombus-like virus 1]
MKGMNASQVGAEFSRKWEALGGDGVAVAIGLDASRFDQHVSVEALRWEHEFYLSICSDPKYRKQLRRWLGWQLENVGYGNCHDGSLKYKVDGTRCSGDMNTGLGNCLIASCLLIAYCEERGLKFELANNGDDCVVFIHKRNLAKFSAGLSHWFLEMGFNMVVEEPVFELEKVVFCQAQPVFDGASWTMVRDPRTCVAKDCVSLKPWRNEKEYSSWIKCVGLSGTSLAGGIPVLDAFYRSFVRAGGAAKPLSLSDPTIGGGLFIASKGMKRRDLSISDAARYSFWRAFDISPDEQVCIELEYGSVTPYYRTVEMDPLLLPVQAHTLLL